MALVSMRQLLDHAAENSYGLPAFNVNNLEQMRAIMEAADLNISGSTLPRRAQTVVAWSQWVAELFAPQQLSLL